MTNIPGLCAKWVRITPECRERSPFDEREMDGGFEEAIQLIREEYEACIGARKPENGATIHVTLTVEWPERG